MTHPTPPSPSGPRRRLRVAGGVVGVGALTLALVPSLGSSSVAAVPQAGAAETAALLAAPDAPPAGRAWIEGQVVNQAGRPLDGIVVEAYRPGDLASLARRADVSPVASWITYADPDVDGPAHGFFRLYVPRSGSGVYVLKASSLPDATDPYEARVLDDEAVFVGAGRSTGVVEDVGEVEMSLARRADSAMRLGASRSVSRTGRGGRLSVAVASPDVTTITGRLRLEIDGRARASRSLRPTDRGRAVFAMPRLRPGRHRISVDYLGSPDVLPTSGAERVEVAAPKRHGRAEHQGRGKRDKAGKGQRGAPGRGGRR